MGDCWPSNDVCTVKQEVRLWGGSKSASDVGDRGGFALGMGNPIIEIQGLTKTYSPSPPWMRFLVRTPIREPILALKDVSFHVREGEVCAVAGPNGAGKTTLFRILVGLVTPSGGRAWIKGNDILGTSPNVRRSIGFMPADSRTLFLRQTVADNLKFHGLVHGMARGNLDFRIDEVLRLVGLEGAQGRVGFALSEGMRARLQLARAILPRPPVLILDEPTGSIDPVGAYDLLVSIRQIAEQEGVAVLLSSHRLEEIEALSDNLLLLDRGVVRYWGALDGLRERWDVRALNVRFRSRASAIQALERMRQYGFEADFAPKEEDPEGEAETRTILAKMTSDVGDLLAVLGDLSTALVAIEKVQIPLIELLSNMYDRPPRAVDVGSD